MLRQQSRDHQNLPPLFLTSYIRLLPTNLAFSRDVRFFFLMPWNLKFDPAARTRISEPSAMLVVFRTRVSGHMWPPWLTVDHRTNTIARPLVIFFYFDGYNRARFPYRVARAIEGLTSHRPRNVRLVHMHVVSAINFANSPTFPFFSLLPPPLPLFSSRLSN